MSYILDALRKADAERRGVPAAPNFGEPTVLMATDEREPERPERRARPWVWLLAGMALTLAGALAWNLWSGPAHEPVAVTAQAPSTATSPEPAPAPPVAAVPDATPAATTPVPSPVAPQPAPVVEELPRFPPPLPPPAAPTPPPAPPVAAVDPAAANRTPPPGIAVYQPAPVSRGSLQKPLALSEVPEAVRRDFPRFTFSGAMYSPRAADRMVVLNGQVYHEGANLGQDLSLTQIKLKSAVIGFRGYLIEVPY